MKTLWTILLIAASVLVVCCIGNNSNGETEMPKELVSVTKNQPPIVLFQNGQWASELGNITVQTPGGDSAWAYDEGMINLYNGVEKSRNAAFRFIFEYMVDMRGYDAVVMELEEAPDAWFGAVLRFRIDQDACWAGEDHTNTIPMVSGTNENDGTMVGMDAGNWDLERVRGVGALPAFGKSVKIKRIYLEGDGTFEPVTINAPNVMDIIPPRTGNKPVREITTSSQYSGTVEWRPDHETFQPNTAYTAVISLMPREGWTLFGVPENWFRIFTPTGNRGRDAQVTHEANSGVLTKTFPKTSEIMTYPEPTQFVALSFDDMYLSDTDALLDVIDRLGIKVTFFASGINLEQVKTNPAYKATLDRVLAAGHEIGNHAWQHERYGENADIHITRADFKRNQDLIIELTGKTPQWFRFPYASHSAESFAVLAELGLTNVYGVSTDDWNRDNSVSFLINGSLTATGRRVPDGQVYVFHNQIDQRNTAQALPEVVHELRMRGCGFMTLSELKEHTEFEPSPGVIYINFVE